MPPAEHGDAGEGSGRAATAATMGATASSDGAALDGLLLISDIDIGRDARFTRRMYAASFAVVAAGIVVYAAIAIAVCRLDGATPLFELAGTCSPLVWCISLIVVMLAAFAVHELVHGMLFKHYAPPGSHITYGHNLQAGVLYAKAEGIVFTVREYRIVALGPTVVVTGAILIAGACLRWPLWTLVLAVAHLSGCVGDWAFVAHMQRDARITHAEDTGDGARFYMNVQ